jgi:hedgehog protein
MVYLEDGTRQAMRDLSIGDRVLTIGASGALEASDVYVMPHAMSLGMFHFKRFTTATNHSVTMTPDHYMLVGDFPEGGWKERRAVPARNVKVGDRVWVMAGVGSQLIETSICEVSDVFEEGIFAPFTLTGTIVADDVVASVYTDMMGSESVMHTFCGWVRWLWGVAPKLLSCLHSLGWDSPISMGIGHLARAGLRLSTTL